MFNIIKQTYYDYNMYPTSYDQLWLSAAQRATFDEWRRRPSGLLLIEGASGSGKTEAVEQFAAKYGWELKYYIGSDIKTCETIRDQFFKECTHSNVIEMMSPKKFIIVIEEFDILFRSTYGQQFINMQTQLRKHVVGMYHNITIKKMRDYAATQLIIRLSMPPYETVATWFGQFTKELTREQYDSAQGDIRTIYEQIEQDECQEEDKDKDISLQEITEQVLHNSRQYNMQQMMRFYDMETAALPMMLYENGTKYLWAELQRSPTQFTDAYMRLLDNLLTADLYNQVMYSTTDPDIPEYIGIFTCYGAKLIFDQYLTNSPIKQLSVHYANHLNRIAQVSTNRSAISRAEIANPTYNATDLYYIPRILLSDDWTEEIQTFVRAQTFTKDQWETIFRANRFLKDKDRLVIYRIMKKYGVTIAI